MMSMRKTEIQVGIAVILGTAILVLGIMWIGEARFHRKWSIYSVYFDRVGGLSVGDRVYVSGLDLGRVARIVLEDGKVRADLQIQQDVVLRADCNVEILSSGIIGERYVHIEPGTMGEILQPGSSVSGRYKPGLSEIIANLGEIMVELKRTTDVVTQVVVGDEGKPGIRQTIEKIDRLLSELNSLLRENRDDIRVATKNIRTASQGISQIVTDRRDQIKASIDDFQQAAARFDSLTVELRSLVSDLERGQGTLGMLIKDNKLHQHLDSTLTNLNLLIEDIKKHPERYIKIKIF